MILSGCLATLLATSGAGGDAKPVVVSPAQEVALGEKVRQEFLREHPLSADGNLAVRVDGVGRKVAAISDRPDLLYRFMVVQGGRPQAYSFPGGTVCVTERLARLFEADDELAFALAHEVAHIAMRHHVFKYRLLQSMDVEAPPERVMLETVMSRFAADQEMEADRYGSLYAVRAGYRFTSAHDALSKLARAGAQNRKGGHPEYADRIGALRSFQDELELSIEAFLAGTDALRAGEVETAIERLQYFVAEFPQSVSGRVNLGAAYLARVRRDAPLVLAETLPILPDPGIVLRGAYDRVDLELARSHFSQALEAAPNDPNALAGLALVHIRFDELDQAKDLLGRALSVEPDSPDLRLCLGNVQFLNAELEQAASTYRAALGLSGGRPEPKWNLALTYERMGRNEEARVLLQELSHDARFGDRARLRLAEGSD